MNPTSLFGGCLCGAVRYEASGRPTRVTHCHCSDCRRHHGAPFVTWATFPRGEVRLLHDAPQELAWAGRLRSFCPRCGTPVIFRDGPDSDETEISAASLDDPTRVTPDDHTWIEDCLPWIQLADGLPTHRRARSPTAQA